MTVVTNRMANCGSPGRLDTQAAQAATDRTNRLKFLGRLSYIQSISRGPHLPRERVGTENNGQRFRQAETPHPAEERGDTYRFHRRGRLYRLGPHE